MMPPCGEPGGCLSLACIQSRPGPAPFVDSQRLSMQITGSTRVFLILGDPVAQVRAPEVFNHLFRKHGADAVLVPAQVPVADFAGFARSVLRAGNIDGLWLAIPHKLGMVALLDHVELVGRVAGAVNAA